MADKFRLNKQPSLLYQMEDNKLLISFAHKLHWILSFCIVLCLYEFPLYSVPLGDHRLVLEREFDDGGG